ncbi:hypothetical protein [Pinibacter soli]|uniref:CHAT domain-containing protein n=1 Tax=Pinibacter soli TaxID=3044211 RepID=A0ABT6RHF2_9BACT|nr:hypothetical protein [Pinibacter soli]MDI3321994.1 hypothetical protein [Pinibacter soli]
MKKTLSRFLSFFIGSKPCAVFFTDSEDCPCFKTINDVNARSFIFRNVLSSDAEHKVEQIKRFNNLIVFAHGDRKSLNFFYYEFKNGAEQKVFISDGWWSSLVKSKRNIYFHSCHGAKILLENSIIRNFFDAWVSYNDIVYGFFSSNDRITSIQRKFFNLVTREVTKKRSPKALKSAIEGAYYSIKGDLEDLGVVDPTNPNCNRDYIFPIIACVGKNISGLNYSTFN